MSVEKMKWMEMVLIDLLETQMECLENVCTKELGEAIDMIKDLEEAIYYHTVTEAMHDKSWETEKSDHPIVMTGSRAVEEHSPVNKKMYMEARALGKDKATQLKELEKYVVALTADITSMMEEASTEERQYVEKKITALASKVGQMK